MILWLFAATVAWASAQDEVEIRHDPIECWPTDQFLFVESTFQPPADVQTAKFYFRSSTYPDFYFVEMTLNRQGTGRAIVPKADPSTVGVVYYIEIVTRGFSAYRSAEMTTSVSTGSECKRRKPAAAFYTGTNPDIALGSTRAGTEAMAPGFQADGISRFIGVQGFAETGGGGGISGKTVAILAGAGGGAGLALALAGGSSESTTTGLGGNTSVTTTAGTTTTAIGGATSTTTTASGGGGSSTTTVTGGPSTTTVSGGSSSTSTGGPSSTTTTGGPSTTTTGSSSTTSTPSTSPSTTISVPVNTADLSVSKSASASGVTVGQTFDYIITVTNHGPAAPSAVGFDDSLPSNVVYLGSTGAGCLDLGGGAIQCGLGSMSNGQVKTVRIRVRATATGQARNSVSVGSVLSDPTPGNNNASHVMTIGFTSREPDGGSVVSFQTELRSSSSSSPPLGGHVVAGGATFSVSEGPPQVHHLDSSSTEVLFEAFVDQGSDGTWAFGFEGAPNVSPPLRVESGQVVSLEPRAVVFAVGRSSARPRFWVTIRERSARPQDP